MERRDLYQDDLTEERDPTPGQREDVAETEALDPDASQDDGNDPVWPDRDTGKQPDAKP